MEVSEELLVSCCLSLSLVVASQAEGGGGNPRGRGAGRADGFDVRQGGLGRDEEATSLAGGPVPPDTHTDTPTRTPHVGRRTSDVGPCHAF